MCACTFRPLIDAARELRVLVEQPACWHAGVVLGTCILCRDDQGIPQKRARCRCKLPRCCIEVSRCDWSTSWSAKERVECNCPRQDHMGSVAVQGRCLQLRRDKHAWGMHFAYCLPHRAHIDIMMATMRAGAIIVNTAQPR